ncbi:uncharacterized protein LOC9643715 [Selaginella moellendorffii]|uniref:uncharacterized protein LOC9643715 n=1 Tax=Selaginella moellendorffii TaxID=88036 RepID=UPI000D1D093F|nr:uncharacterized protein LOC9643715 [Selaginella moellendorffii]|eukprot:XP_024524193.1 uncharacterized protein LOC9643715 [Selaginella moellendorffii]
MVSSSDGRAIANWSSCLESLRRFVLVLPLEEHDGSMWKKNSPGAGKNPSSQERHSNLRANARKEFVQAIVGREELGVVICDPERLPPLEAAYVDFLRMFPRFAESLAVDDMRAREYAHLRHRVCCDYSGFGLFSHLQRVCNSPSSSFRLAYVSANLPTHALYGSSTGSSSLESHVRRKIMDHFRISDTDYCMVFTASKGSAVKLLAESYRFDLHQRLLTSYDHHSQSIEWMIGCAREKGAKVSSVRFRWPSLRICSRELRKQLVEKKVSGRRTVKGLFVFPLQSRVTGARYSYQWIPFAQENHWQVLLDASALGPRDMDALGLSVFRPDFIVSSFYKVFGADPSGFGCLFIKRSAIKCLHNTTRARSVGMVKLLSCPSSQLGEEERPEFPPGLERDVDPSNVSSFSGPLSAEEIRAASGEISSSLADNHADHHRATQETCASAPGKREASRDKEQVEEIMVLCPRPSEEVDDKKSEIDDTSTHSSPRSAQSSRGSPTFKQHSSPHSSSESSPQQIDIKGKRKMEEVIEEAESSRWRSETGGPESSTGHGESSSQLRRNLPEIFVETSPPPPPPPPKTLIELLSRPAPEKRPSLPPSPPPPAPPAQVKRLVELLHDPAVSDGGSSDLEEEDELRVVCKALDQTKVLGMINIKNRLRYLISWLLLSLAKLRHPASSSHGFKAPLVQIYGPSGRKYDRGASMAFNLYDWDGLLFQPTLVQRLADRNSISLGLAQIKNVKFVDLVPDFQNISPRKSNAFGSSQSSSPESQQEFLVVTIALSYVSSFEDVYRVWEFVAKFLDADFVNKEVWRYHAINQQMVVLGSL